MKFPCIPLYNRFMARIIGATLFLLVLTTMALNFYFSMRSAGRLKDNLIHHNRSLVRSLARSSRIAVFTGNKDQLAAAASYMVNDRDCQVVVFFDENGIPLQVYKGRAYREEMAALPEQVLSQHLREHTGDYSFVSETGGGLVMVEPVLAEPKYSAEELYVETGEQASAIAPSSLIGYVAMLVDSSSIRREAKTMFIRDTVITIGITLLSCLSILAVIRYSVALPLRGLVGEIRRLQDNGDKGGGGKVAPIPGDFAEMIGILRTSYNTIYELKSTLEEKVAARTRQLVQSNQELVAQKNALASTNEQLAETLAELRSTQAQLVQSEKMAALGMMISGLSHEIKNSINFIASSVPLLEMTLANAQQGGECPSARFKELLGNIREGVDRTVRVVSDLATFCHEGGTGFAPTDILPGLKSSVGIVRREFGDRIEFVEEHPEALPMIRGLAGQLNQVFLNILLNAAQSINDRGTVTIKSWAEKGTVHVAITDTGSGIDSDVINRIFDPFFTTKAVGKGTGLGLSISFSTIKNHGGDILVRSEPGSGSTFEVVLPV